MLKNWSTRFETSSQGGTECLEHVRLCAEIGKECINHNPTERPDTWTIIKRLKEMEGICGFIETDLCTSAAQVSLLMAHSMRPLDSVIFRSCIPYHEYKVHLGFPNKSNTFNF